MTDYETLIRKGGTSYGVCDRPCIGRRCLNRHAVQRRGQRGW